MARGGGGARCPVLPSQGCPVASGLMATSGTNRCGSHPGLGVDAAAGGSQRGAERLRQRLQQSPVPPASPARVPIWGVPNPSLQHQVPPRVQGCSWCQRALGEGLCSQRSRPVTPKHFFWMLKCSKETSSHLRRFFCPPPCVYLSGPGWKLKQEQIKGKHWAQPWNSPPSLPVPRRAALHRCKGESDQFILSSPPKLLFPPRG